MSAAEGHLKATLARLPNPWQAGTRRWTIELTFPRLVEQLAARYSNLDVSSLEPYDLMQVYREVMTAWRERTLASLPRLTLRRAAQILFWRNVPEVLGANPMFLKVYFKVLRERYFRVSMAKALLFVFFRDYPVDYDTFPLFSRLVREFVEGIASESAALQKWRDNIRRYDLLSPQAPKKVAQAWFGRGSPLQLMADAGFVGELAQRGFIVSVAKEATALLSQQLKDDRATVEHIKWINDLCTEGSQFRFANFAKWFAESMLLPFQNKQPRPDLKDAITNVLLRVLGDPRVSRWHQVDEQARQILIRWLIGDTIEEFFRVIDRSAEPAWAYRRAFWMAYHRRGFISDVWVIFGSEARSQAYRWGEQLRLPRGSYGILLKGNSRQSALLIRIGSLTILEWSHAGACRIWTTTDGAPQLYGRRYEREDLMREGYQERILHQGSERYQWQQRLAHYIFRYTGVSINSRDYMVVG